MVSSAPASPVRCWKTIPRYQKNLYLDVRSCNAGGKGYDRPEAKSADPNPAGVAKPERYTTPD
jgi:hypothetical protein